MLGEIKVFHAFAMDTNKLPKQMDTMLQFLQTLININKCKSLNESNLLLPLFILACLVAHNPADSMGDKSAVEGSQLLVYEREIIAGNEITYKVKCCFVLHK